MIKTLYLVHHSHTDIGFTNDAPIVWDLNGRFIEKALDLIENTAGNPEGSRFRWTCETAAPVLRWLKTAGPSQIKRFQALERKGLIEVCAHPLHLAPLYNQGEAAEAYGIVQTLREHYGLRVEWAMSCDINGHNWPLADVLIDLGIKGLSMAINTHSGRAPFARPNAFKWEAPSGRTLTVWNGFEYGRGEVFAGRPGDADMILNEWWPQHLEHLEAIGYPHDFLLLQGIDPFGDNAGPTPDYAEFIRQWNVAGHTPRVELVTPRTWIKVLKQETENLPVHRGDWTDFWNYGSGSAAREMAVATRTRVRLDTADRLAALETVLPDSPEGRRMRTQFERQREEAWSNQVSWYEHTWGADCGTGAPHLEDSASQWNHKAHLAYQARSLSLMLQRDLLGTLGAHLKDQDPDRVLLFNPLPWERVIQGNVPASINPPRGRAEDELASRHGQDRKAENDLELHPPGPTPWAGQNPDSILPPTTVPALGYTVVSKSDFLVPRKVAETVDPTDVLENHRHRLSFDSETGGVTIWHDRDLDHQWVDHKGPSALGAFVHERVDDAYEGNPRQRIFHMDWLCGKTEIPSGWQPDWPAVRKGPSRVLETRCLRLPYGSRMVQRLEAPGIVGDLWQSVFLPDFADWVEFESWWDQGIETWPQANYVVFPLNLPGATTHLDAGGIAFEPGREQLPGSCHDYYQAQGWVDFSNRERGLILANPENLLGQIGGFHFGQAQTEFHGRPPWFLGWVTNNYWETNFRGCQPGRVRARYRLLPHAGGYNETDCHRFGRETAHSRPLMQKLGEDVPGLRRLPEEATLLQLPDSLNPDSPVHTVQIKPGDKGRSVIVRLFNVSDKTATAQISSGLLQITSARKGPLFGRNEKVRVRKGTLSFTIPSRRMVDVAIRAKLKG